MTKLATSTNKLLDYHFLAEGQWKKVGIYLSSLKKTNKKKPVVQFYWWVNAANNLSGETQTNERPARD